MGRIAIVEYDCLSPAGFTLEESWQNMSQGRSGLSTITRYAPANETLMGLPWASYGGQVPASFEEMAGASENFKRWAEPSYHAVNTLCNRIFGRLDFNISQHDPQRISVLGGTALTSQYSRDILTRTQKPDSKYILNQCQNIPLGVAASAYGLQGPCFTIGSACASSAHALLVASQLILCGTIDCALVLGYEFPLMPFSVAGLDWVNAVYRRDAPEDRGYGDSAQASRPFSQDRRGFVPSEGAGAMFLSRSEYARKLGWEIKGYIRGGYSNCDADHLTRPSADNITRCMLRALQSAECSPGEISCVNAHATSTPAGDAVELRALHNVLGDRLKNTPVVANKSQIGHALGASSILAATFAVHGMKQGVLLPTLNHIPDPALPEAFIPKHATEHPHQLTLQNSFGFGGTNVSLILEGLT
jgi:3-oxoacyl-[acyl-carrier-protein] synthase II